MERTQPRNAESALTFYCRTSRVHSIHCLLRYSPRPPREARRGSARQGEGSVLIRLTSPLPPGPGRSLSRSGARYSEATDRAGRGVQ